MGSVRQEVDLEVSFVYTDWVVWASTDVARKRILLHVPTVSSTWQGHNLRHSTQGIRSGNRSPAERKRRTVSKHRLLWQEHDQLRVTEVDIETRYTDLEGMYSLHSSSNSTDCTDCRGLGRVREDVSNREEHENWDWMSWPLCECRGRRLFAIKREIKRRLIYEDRWDERLKPKNEESTRLGDNRLVVELEHLKTKTRLRDKKFTSVRDECEI
jgi:hypothetical protein